MLVSPPLLSTLPVAGADVDAPVDPLEPSVDPGGGGASSAPHPIASPGTRTHATGPARARARPPVVLRLGTAVMIRQMRLELGMTLKLGALVATGCTASPPPMTTEASTTHDSSADDPSATSATSPSPSTTGIQTDPTPPESTTGSTDDGTTTGPGPDTTETSLGSTTESTPTEGTTTEGGNEACADGCAVEFACGTRWASEQECVMWCEANLEKADAFSPFCRDAWEGVSACLGTLTCEEFAEWESPTVFPYPCSDADVVLDVECEGQ